MLTVKMDPADMKTNAKIKSNLKTNVSSFTPVESESFDPSVSMWADLRTDPEQWGSFSTLVNGKREMEYGAKISAENDVIKHRI